MKICLSSQILLLLPLVVLAGKIVRTEEWIEPYFKIIFRKQNLIVNAVNLNNVEFRLSEDNYGRPALRVFTSHYIEKSKRYTDFEIFEIKNPQNQTFIEGSFVVESWPDSDVFYIGCYKSMMRKQISSCYGKAKLRNLNDQEKQQMKELADSTKSKLQDYYHVSYTKGNFIAKQTNVREFGFKRLWNSNETVQFLLSDMNGMHNITRNVTNESEFELRP